jgi:hypothetical protein
VLSEASCCSREEAFETSVFSDFGSTLGGTKRIVSGSIVWLLQISSANLGKHQQQPEIAKIASSLDESKKKKGKLPWQMHFSGHFVLRRRNFITCYGAV